MRKQSVLKVWVISYIFIFVIPLTTILVNYVNNSNALKREIYSGHELILEKLAGEMDGILAKEREYAKQIMATPELFIMLQQNERNGEFYYAASNLYNKKQELETVYEHLSSIICFPAKDYVIGSRADISTVYYRGSAALQEQVSYEQWTELLFGKQTNDFSVEKYITGKATADMTEEHIVYAETIKWGRTEVANIFVSIPATIMNELTEFMTDGSILVFNIDGQACLAFSSEGITELPEDMDYMNPTETTYEKDNNMIIRRQSGEKNIEYYMIVPKRDFLYEYRSMRNMFFISLACTLLVGIICLVLVVKHNYNPLYSLCRLILGDEGTGNEFLNLENAYNKLQEEKRRITKTAINTHNTAQSFYLLAIMKGWPITKQIFENVQNNTEQERFILIAFSLPVTGDDKEDDLFSFIVNNLFSEYMTDEKFYVIEENQCLYYIFCVKDTTDWKNKCMMQLHALEDFLTKKTEKPLLIAVSHWESEIENIRKQYLAVQEVLECKRLFGEKGIYDTEKRLDDEDILVKVVEYVRSNYTNPDLNVNAVVNEVGGNSKLISRNFKNKTGMSILDYIHTMRIRRAQELIQQEDKTLEEIYTMVGYTNDVTFRRVFFKITGMLPKDYKEKI